MDLTLLEEVRNKVTELDQEEIYDRMQKYWIEADDFHRTAAMSHLALPEVNAVVDHALLMMDNIVLQAASVYSTGEDSLVGAMQQFENKKASLLIHIFLAAYNMGIAGDPLIKVPAGCAHNHGIEN